jgi:endonuclease/exonuclease/phosphatase family metal-dependent hydrolase
VAHGWRFELGRARAAARIGFDYLQSVLLPVTASPTAEPDPPAAASLTLRESGPDHPLPKRARVICWNLHRAYDATGVVAGLRAVFAELAPDVLMLQEVPVWPEGPWWSAEGVFDLLDEHRLVFAPMHRVGRPTPYYPFLASGLLVAVRGGFARPSAALLPAVSRPKLGRGHRVERVVVGVRCRFEGAAVGVWNVHLENTTRPSGRELQARAVTAVAGDGPAIVAGDFNTMIPRLEGVDRAFRDAGFARVAVSGPTGMTPQLDHFFVRGVRALWAERLPIAGSDHRPICGEFEVER